MFSGSIRPKSPKQLFENLVLPRQQRKRLPGVLAF